MEKSSQKMVFDDGDKGASFIKYCQENGIKRKDGQELVFGQGIDADETYIGENGTEFKLKMTDGGAQGYDDGAFTEYELIKTKEVVDVREHVQKNGQDLVFDDGDRGASFIKYCQENGIKRKDEKELVFGQGIDADTTYVGENGDEYKLEMTDGGAWGYDDGAFTQYSLIKVKKVINLEEMIQEDETKLEEPIELEETEKPIKPIEQKELEEPIELEETEKPIKPVEQKELEKPIESVEQEELEKPIEPLEQEESEEPKKKNIFLRVGNWIKNILNKLKNGVNSITQKAIMSSEQKRIMSSEQKVLNEFAEDARNGNLNTGDYEAYLDLKREFEEKQKSLRERVKVVKTPIYQEDNKTNKGDVEKEEPIDDMEK